MVFLQVIPKEIYAKNLSYLSMVCNISLKMCQAKINLQQMNRIWKSCPYE